MYQLKTIFTGRRQLSVIVFDSGTQGLFLLWEIWQLNVSIKPNLRTNIVEYTILGNFHRYSDQFQYLFVNYGLFFKKNISKSQKNVTNLENCMKYRYFTDCECGLLYDRNKKQTARFL